MKTHEEIKQALKLCGRGCYSGCPYNSFECVEEMSHDALAYIQQLENHIGELTEKVAQLEAAQPKWISVEERLPEKPCSVLVSVHGIILKGWYEDGSFEMISGYKFNAYDRNSVIAYWMPLQEPPKEESK